MKELSIITEKFVMKSLAVSLIWGIFITGIAFGSSGDMGASTEPLTDGSAAYPYLIEDFADFQVFADSANSATYWAGGVHIRLMTDINMSNQSHSPVGNSSIPFAGQFNGNSHFISNLTAHSTTDNQGLFGLVDSGGEVKNIGLINVNIGGLNRVGSLIGYNKGVVSDCYATGNVTEAQSNIISSWGGLIGTNEGSVIRCRSVVSVGNENNQRDSIGGLVGYNSYSGTISQCYAQGTVYGSDEIGGLVGQNSGSINNSYAKGSVAGGDRVGGLVGYQYQGLIEKCYATGAVSKNETLGYSGGLIGLISYGIIRECYSVGLVNNGLSGGGLIHDNINGTITNCFWDVDASGRTFSDGGAGKTTVEMQTESTYTNAGWDFSNSDGDPADWKLPSGDYPQLAWEQQKYSDGSGMLSDPYQISNVGDWQELFASPEDWSAHFIVTSDLDFTGITSLSPIGIFYVVDFMGILDGNGHEFTNITMDLASENYVGLFESIGSEGEIRNLELSNIDISGNNYVGSLAGFNAGIISDCYASGTVAGTSSVGGLIGDNRGTVSTCHTSMTVSSSGDNIGGLVGYSRYGGAINDCYSEVIVTSTAHSVGGLVGHMGEATIERSHSSGTVTSDGSYVGGLVGQTESSCGIYDSYSVASVTGYGCVGGLIGDAVGSLVRRCYASGAVDGDILIGGLCGYNSSTVENSYALGAVIGDDSVGGLVGENNYGRIRSCYAAGLVTGNTKVGGLCGYFHYHEISDSFWDMDATRQTTSSGGSTTGLTTSEMQTESIFTNAGWDLATPIWFMYSCGDGYPHLAWEEFEEPGYSGGSGTQTDPYQISTVEDLNTLGESCVQWHQHFVLTADIDMDSSLTGIPPCTMALIAPDTDPNAAGFQGRTFIGTFDGAGHTISNFTSVSSDSDYVGLFGNIGVNGKIRNLGLPNANFNAPNGMHVGCLAGFNAGTIEECFVDGRIACDSNAGLLVGDNTGIILNSYTTGNITGNAAIGGLAGYNSGIVENCYSIPSLPRIYWTDYDGAEINRANIDGSSRKNLVRGLLLSPDNIVLDTSAYKIYWMDSNMCRIQRADLDGSGVEELVTGSCGVIALDTTAEKMYWTDNNTSLIRRSNLDGSNIEDLVTGLGHSDGIALDVVAGKMYWTDQINDKIQRANLDGSEIEDLAVGVDNPYSILVDAAAGKLYWVSYAWSGYTGDSTIQRSNLDGSNVEDLATGLNRSFVNIALDIEAGKIYWTESVEGTINRSDLDGSNIEELAMGLGRHTSFALDAASGKIYLADDWDGCIQRANLDGSNIEDFLTTGLRSPFSIAVDIVSGLVYWTDNDYGNGKIQRSDLDGSDIEDLVADIFSGSEPGDIALDTIAGKMYWTSFEYNGIHRSSLDGSDIEQVITGAYIHNEGIALDTTAEKMYWSDRDTGKIRRSNLDGSNLEDLVTTGGCPRKISLDTNTGKMYWTDYCTDKIQRSNLDGSDIEELVTVSCDAIALDTTSGKMYWIDHDTGLIRRSNLDGTEVEDIVTTELSSSVDIALEIYSINGVLIGQDNAGSYIKCFYDNEKHPDINGIGNNSDPNVIGKTTIEMQTVSTFADAGWDLVGEDVNGMKDVWRLCNGGNDYPSLNFQQPSGDLNCPDGVGVEDLTMLADFWGSTLNPDEGADLTGDGLITLEDFAVLAHNWLEGT